jgi:hypothetical protein
MDLISRFRRKLAKQPRSEAAVACAALLIFSLAVSGAARQSNSDQKSLVPSSGGKSSPQANHASSPEFISAADQVLLEMSKILDLPVKEPLKKSLRSKQEVRDYLIREDKEDKNDAQRYADAKTLEAFGLIPKNFPLDSFMLDVLTDQVAGLYDPKAKEFYIADWIPVDEQRTVMSHELTHALEDQSFRIDNWIKAARPNDDAELARESISEGSAMAAMVDYQMLEQHIGVRELPDVTLLIRAGAVTEMDKDPNLAKAPNYIRDELLFPYLAGTGFTQQFLKAHTGWKDLHLVFENPPVSTQQVIHPDLYFNGTKPEAVTLPDWKGLVPDDWKLLQQNTMGEFGLDEILKQFKKEGRDESLSAAWKGDRYAVFEDAKSKSTPLVFRLALDNPEDAARFFGQYSEALELKHSSRTNLFRRPNFFQFQSDLGGVFLRCVESTCLAVEGATREIYDKVNKAIGWTPAPAVLNTSPTPQTMTQRRTGEELPSPRSAGLF